MQRPCAHANQFTKSSQKVSLLKMCFSWRCFDDKWGHMTPLIEPLHQCCWSWDGRAPADASLLLTFLHKQLNSICITNILFMHPLLLQLIGWLCGILESLMHCLLMEPPVPPLIGALWLGSNWTTHLCLWVCFSIQWMLCFANWQSSAFSLHHFHHFECLKESICAFCASWGKVACHGQFDVTFWF